MTGVVFADRSAAHESTVELWYYGTAQLVSTNILFSIPLARLVGRIR